MSDWLVTIRPPRDVEGPACRLLLPDIGKVGGPIEALVAIQTAGPQLAGVIGFHQAPAALLGVQLRVVRTVRRRGIGSALLRALVENARQRGAREIFGRWNSELDPEAAAFAARHGFVEHSRLTAVEGPLDSVLAPVAATRDRMRAHGRIPQGARIVPLSAAPPDQVAALYAEHIIHNPQLRTVLTARLESTRRLELSPVLMLGEQVAGILLWSKEGQVAQAYARVIAPPYRGGWANGYLMAAALEAAAGAGARVARFEIPGGNRDTLKLARRMRAEVRGTVYQWRLLLAGQES
jgi:GNAT superfamily N-acetyltransferase